MLRIPYLYDRDAIYFIKENKYSLVKDGRKFVVKYHMSKVKAPIIIRGKVKSIANNYTKITLMEVKG